MVSPDDAALYFQRQDQGLTAFLITVVKKQLDLGNKTTPRPWWSSSRGPKWDFIMKPTACCLNFIDYRCQRAILIFGSRPLGVAIFQC